MIRYEVARTLDARSYLWKSGSPPRLLADPPQTLAGRRRKCAGCDHCEKVEQWLNGVSEASIGQEQTATGIESFESLSSKLNCGF
jgi:hypothetical protein